MGVGVGVGELVTVVMVKSSFPPLSLELDRRNRVPKQDRSPSVIKSSSVPLTISDYFLFVPQPRGYCFLGCCIYCWPSF